MANKPTHPAPAPIQTSPEFVELAGAVGRKLGNLAGRTYKDVMAKLDGETAKLRATLAEAELRLERQAAADRDRIAKLEAEIAGLRGKRQR